MFAEITAVLKGGEGSGNFDHAGRPGKVGGSAPSYAKYIIADSSKLRSVNGQVAGYITPDGQLVDINLDEQHADHATFAIYHDMHTVDIDKSAVLADYANGNFPDELNAVIKSMFSQGYMRFRKSNNGLSVEFNEISTRTMRRLQRLIDANKIPYANNITFEDKESGVFVMASIADFMSAKSLTVSAGGTAYLKELPIEGQSTYNLIAIRIGVFNQTVDSLSEQLYTGAISIGAWEERMKAEIRALHTATAAIGKGSFADVTQSDWGRVGSEVKKQYRYLHNFAEHIAENRESLSLRAIQARAHMYGNASRHTAVLMQAGEFAGGTRRKPGRFKGLPWMPGDGSTECLINCKCHWELKVIGTTKDSKLVRAVWKLSVAEHCADCIDRNEYTIIIKVPLDTVVPDTVGIL